MARMVRFETRWWRVRLPEGWLGHHEGIGAALFLRDPLRGAFQIAGVLKGSPLEAREVSDDDLLDFAWEDFPRLPPSSVRFGMLSGFYRERVVARHRWSRWWLGHGPLMVFATYVVALRDEDESELAEADEILASLKPKIRSQEPRAKS